MASVCNMRMSWNPWGYNHGRKTNTNKVTLEMVVQIADEINSEYPAVQTAILTLLHGLIEYRKPDFMNQERLDHCLRLAGTSIRQTEPGHQEPKSMAVLLLYEITDSLFDENP